MTHQAPLISTVVVGLVLAFTLGALAHRVRISRRWSAICSPAS